MGTWEGRTKPNQTPNLTNEQKINMSYRESIIDLYKNVILNFHFLQIQSWSDKTENHFTLTRATVDMVQGTT